MGQRFTIDGMILQNLIFDFVDQSEDGSHRLFPSGLDVMAVFGSEPAYQTLVESGSTDYPNYLQQMEILREAVAAQTESEWRNKFYDSWLYIFFPLLNEKGTEFPPFMHSEGWDYKEINTARGNWAELKHDTVLYTKMPEGAGGGGPPTSGSAPGYVEPNPEAFYRLGYMAEVLLNGLNLRGYNVYFEFSHFTELGRIAGRNFSANLWMSMITI
jgi:hypothetical protein